MLVDPAFRQMDEIFSPGDVDRLHRMAEVVWAEDGEMPTADFVRQVADVDVVVFGSWRHGDAALDAALAGRRLQALLEVSGGHGHDLDYRRCLAAGVRVGSCAPAFGEVVAEMGLTLALASVRGVVAADRAMAARNEEWLHGGNTGNSTLLGATVGFVGCGGISRSLQRMLRPFDVTILGYDPPLPPAVLTDRGIESVALDTLFSRSKVIFVLAAPTPDNQNLVDRALMEHLGPDQTLVVLSRGHLVDFGALTDLTAMGRFRVATDVYPIEPLAGDSPLRDLDNVITVPHIAGALPEALRDIGRRVVDDIEALSRGQEPTAMQYMTEANLTGLRQPTAS